MRAGPLSDNKVIELLNRAFVCVYTVNEDYTGKNACVAVDERKELQRIRQEGHQKKLSVGTVHAYVLTPDGHTYDSRHVASAARTAQTLAMLEQAVAHFKPKEGAPVVKPEPQSKPPKAPDGAVVLHLVSRGDDRGSWGEFPGENWIVLTREEWMKLLPEGAKVGEKWQLDTDVTAKVLTYFYPQTENNRTPTSRIEKQQLTAKVLSSKDGVLTARIDGAMRMQHVFYPGRKDAQPVEASIVGVLRVTRNKGIDLQLATTQAVHGKRPFKVAVRTLPPQ